MRKLLWIFMAIGGYIWLVTSGNDEWALNQGKAFYRAVVAWFDDAEVDFQMKKSKPKKRERRWD